MESTHNTREGIEEIMDLAKSYARQYYLTAEENDSFENLKKKEEEIRQSIHQELQKTQETWFKKGYEDAESVHKDELQKARGDWYIGQRLNIFKGDYVVVGTSTMVYDEDCEGEPEWKITDEVQEVAIAQYYNDTSYQKPCWLKVTALQSELDQPTECEHEWGACPGVMCTSDLHNQHCLKCNKHRFVLPVNK